MLGGSSILRLVCLLSFIRPHAASLYRTYIDNLRGGLAGRDLKRNALYSSYDRTNYSWLPKINSMAFSSTRKNKWSDSRRRQDIYDGSEFDWEGFPMEDTPTWPPDYNSWPQTATQAPPEALPQYPPLVPTQAPLQAPYQVPPGVPTQMSVPVVSRVSPSLTVPQARPPFSTSQAQIWPSRVKPHNNMKMPVKLEVRNASRVCSPGPPLGVNPVFRNCLVIGDSISLGYLTTVKGELKGLCQVQHAPFAKGSGAVDSRYGLQCLSMMLHTIALEPTSYDAVVFNFGMHDIDYSKLFPEEFVPLEEYGQNLMKIKEILLQSGAQVAFALTTPVPIAGRRNKRVVKYNKEARRVMEDGRKVEIVDLHSAVIHECGEPPYETCSIMKRPRDVHFNPKGNRLLGVQVGAAFRSLLSKAKPRGQFSPPKAPELSAREGLASSYLYDDTSTFCPDMVTRCPTRTTCCENLLSLTGYGCCMEPDAVNCADNWHCCPRGTHCSPDCNFRSCKCLFPSFHPAHASKLSKDAKESKVKSNSHSESRSTSGKLMKESEGKKEVSKTEKGKKKKTKAKDTSSTKSRKKSRGKSKHKLKLKDKKNKKHKHKGRRKTKKFRSKAKDKGEKSEKLKKLKKTKAIHKINKHVVKAHRTYQQNNFHPTIKQHWVALLDKRLGAVTKHKPNIKFSHAWGKRKHQKLSFKSNGKKNKGLQTDASMADELKHLIVKHRKEKLGGRLKLRVNGHTKDKHGSHRNGFIDRKKSTTTKEGKGRTIHPTHTRNIFKHRDSHSNSRNKNVQARKTPHEVKAANKVETNKSRHEKQMLGHQNSVSVNVFNNLRQTLHEKVLAKENISLGLNPSKSNGKIAKHFATNTSDNKTDKLGKSKADIIVESEKATDSSTDLQRTSSSSSKNEPQHTNTVNLVEHSHNSTTNTSKNLPRTSFMIRTRTSSGSDKYTNKVNLKEMSDASSNASINLVEHLHNSTSNSSSSTNESESSNSAIVSVSNVVTKEGRMQPQVGEKESRANSSIITKPNPTESRIDKITAGDNQNRLLKVNGKVKHGARQHNKILATNGTKNISSAGTASVPLVKGMRNQAKADSVFSGSRLQADEFTIGSASGLEAGAKNVSSADTKSVRLVIGMPRKKSKADWVVSGSGSGLKADESNIGSASGLEMATTGAKNVSSADTKSVRLVMGMPRKKSKADWVVSGSGLKANESNIGSASGPEMAMTGAKNVSSADTQSVRLVMGMPRKKSKADWVVSGSGLKANESNIGSASGPEMAMTGAKNVSSADTQNVRLVIGMPRKKSKADRVVSGSGLKADESNIGSASGPEMPTAGAKNVSSAGTDSVRLVKGMHNPAEADRVVSGGGLEADEFSTGSAGGVEMATTFSGDFDDSSIDEHIKVFLGGEDTESSTIDLEKNKTTKELPLIDLSSEISTNEGEGSYKTSPWKSLNAESADVVSFSGSSLEIFSSESGWGSHFGGEGEHDSEEKPGHGDEKYFDASSGRDDIYQSRLFPPNGTTSLNQLQKLKTTENEQSITDISQMTYNDWDDAKETHSGLGSGHHESSTDQWDTGSGVDGFSSGSLSTEAKPISSSHYTAAKTSNIANSIRQSSGDAGEERYENKMVSGEGMNLEKRNHIFTSNVGSQMQLSEEKRRRSKSLRQKHTEKAKDLENNEFLSWEDRELKQLLYWLSTANGDDNKHFNQIMAYKDIASGFSKLHSMVLQKMLPHFSESEGDEVKGRTRKEKETFSPDTSLVSSATDSGTESSYKFKPEFKGDAENEPEYKEGSNTDLQ